MNIYEDVNHNECNHEVDIEFDDDKQDLGLVRNLARGITLQTYLISEVLAPGGEAPINVSVDRPGKLTIESERKQP